ncbi:alpha/beta hydrolase family protein [Hydrogenophaga defluvii]|uniref:Alpha/beta hydrolase family protein n=1 Tax=Hydrogenophaga defluvii TaxID=249410 RepID=A0ABW2S8J5_9BURK
MPRLQAAVSESPVIATLPEGGAPTPPEPTLPAHLVRWHGLWQGWACGGRQCDVRLAVERVSATQVTVAFAHVNPLQGLFAERAVGQFVGDELVLPLTGARLTLRLRNDGDMEMAFWKPEKQLLSVGVLTQKQIQTPYTRTIERIPTPWNDGERQQTLEMVVYRPLGNGPFPTLVFNHGSTGAGNRPEWFKLTWSSPEVAHYFTNQGWQVLFPQRRGRGQSDGLYDEGFSADRSKGYSCEPERAIAGFDRAVADLDVVMTHILARPDVDRAQVLVGGVSRGGILSVAYAGRRPEMFKGVLNFVGGWLGDGCRQVAAVNPVLMQRGANFKRPTLWLYGDRDPYYKLSHSRNNFEAFKAAGGQGEFLTFEPAPGRDGHSLHNEPFIWTSAVDRYLAAALGR